MIGNKLEQSIVSVFQNNLTKTFSINEVSKQLKKSYPLINHKSNFFLKEGVLRKINVGRSYQCFLNLGNDKTKTLMLINEINKRENFLERNKEFIDMHKNIQEIFHKINSAEEKVSMILLYKNDILFVFKKLDTQTIDEIQSSLAMPPKFKLSFYTMELLREELLNDEDMQANHTILEGPYSYLNLLSSISDRLLAKGMLKKI